jgi:hypothetical protein
MRDLETGRIKCNCEIEDAAAGAHTDEFADFLDRLGSMRLSATTDTAQEVGAASDCGLVTLIDFAF